MSDYMILEYLRKHPDMRSDEVELIDDFKDFMRAKSKKSMRGSRRDKEYFEEYGHDYYDLVDEHDDTYKIKSTRRDSMHGSHVSEHLAKEIVDDMFHYDNNRRIVGEYFTMKKAEEVMMKYKDHMASNTTVEEVYIAINATYHDFCTLFKSWFGSNMEDKIILLAITFWFKDEDYHGNKIMNYFM